MRPGQAVRQTANRGCFEVQHLARQLGHLQVANGSFGVIVRLNRIQVHPP